MNFITRQQQEEQKNQQKKRNSHSSNKTLRRNAANMYDIKAIEFGQQTTTTTTTTATTTTATTKTIPTTTCATTARPNQNSIFIGVIPTTATTTTTTAGSLNSSNTSGTLLCSPPTKQYATQPLQRAYSTCSIISHGKLDSDFLSHSAAVVDSSSRCSSSISGSCSSLTLTRTRNPAESTHMTLLSLSLRRRRLFQRHACLLSILAAFVFGLALGVFMPMFGLPSVFTPQSAATASAESTQLQMLPLARPTLGDSALNHTTSPAPPHQARPPSHFPTIYEPLHAPQGLAHVPLETSTVAVPLSAATAAENPFSVAFIKERDVELSAEEIFRNAFHLQQAVGSPDALLVKKLDASDGSIREFRVQRIAEGRYRKGPERRLSKPSLVEQMLPVGASATAAASESVNVVPLAQRIVAQTHNQRHQNDAGGGGGIIKDDIYWGDLVERALPRGFSAQDTNDWNRYLATQGVVERLELGCGRMQNRLVVFADGTRACARYRQNTDQIQGELFSFYLGQLLNLSNLAPSAAAVVDLDARTWSSAVADITQAQWKQQRPVVLTRWLPDLEPAGIPQPFQPLERHLNKYDVWNITLGAAAEAMRTAASSTAQPTAGEAQRGLLKRLGAANSAPHNHQSTATTGESAAVAAAGPLTFTTTSFAASSASFTTHSLANQTQTQLADALNETSFGSNTVSTAVSGESASPVLQRLIELAQWSDLIVFDYLIANLDRVVNNLYNFQWNADIMAAPAHNLARQSNTQLLVFLDNESGLLHGYRLLKKYEAYHGLLLDNLCVFRKPTIEALQQLRAYGAGHRLRQLFEQTTSAELRDVLPTLPDKSIKILVDRIDRVLGQVQKCQELLANR